MAIDTDSAVAAGAGGGGGHNPLFRFFFVHEVTDQYPRGARRAGYLALAVLATILLYYTYYTQTGVTPNILRYYHMSFSFYVGIVIVSNLIGAFASLPAGKTDRLGRANVIIYGLLIVGLLVAVGVPATHSEWSFAIVISAIGLVEGAILVATPAMVRDFSPQVGRASAMGFWTVGPVAGSLLTSIIASATLNHFLNGAPSSGWKSQFVISGVAAIVLFVICLVFMKDLSAGIRDQLMVTERDRALVEARARGISIAELESGTKHPWRQILKWDLVGSAFGIAVFLLVYYAAAGFFTIFFSTVFVNSNGLNLSVTQANGLNKWIWATDAISLILVGVVSDLLKVRKSFMLVGAIGSIVSLIVLINVAGHPHTGYYTIVLVGVILAFFLSVTYAPWMASYTETVEAKNPALVGTGLALWGWILRVVVGISFIFLPMVITAVNPVVDNLAVAQTPPNGTAPFNVAEFQLQHPKTVAFATQHAAFLTVLSSPTVAPVVARLNQSLSPANIAAAQKVLTPAQLGELSKLSVQLKALVVPYESQLKYLAGHQAALIALQKGVKESPSQWQRWFWVCIGGMVVFIPTIWLNRGRWSPGKAKDDERNHEEDVERELRELAGANA